MASRTQSPTTSNTSNNDCGICIRPLYPQPLPSETTSNPAIGAISDHSMASAVPSATSYLGFINCPSCRKRLHRRCLQTWHAQRSARRCPTTCPYCRTPFPRDWLYEQSIGGDVSDPAIVLGEPSTEMQRAPTPNSTSNDEGQASTTSSENSNWEHDMQQDIHIFQNQLDSLRAEFQRMRENYTADMQ
ncbi:hypothetical protein HK097_001782, partial [Rhizophlyctis rosea]